MKSVPIYSMLIAMLLLAACQISVNNGSHIVNGIALEHKNQSKLSEYYDSSELSVDVGSGNINLTGVVDHQVNLEVEYYEYKPGDASIVIKDGAISYESKSGKPVMIMDVSGTIPQNLALDIDTGSGNISLNNIKSSQKIRLDTGSGDCQISNTKVDELIANTGSGEVNIDNSVATSFEADTGSGDISLSDCRIQSANIDTGSGNLVLLRSKIQHRVFETGSGTLSEEGQVVTEPF